MPPTSPFSTANERRAAIVAIVAGWLLIPAYLVMVVVNLIGALRDGASGNLLARVFSFAGMGADLPWIEGYALANVVALIVLDSWRHARSCAYPSLSSQRQLPSRLLPPRRRSPPRLLAPPPVASPIAIQPTPATEAPAIPVTTPVPAPTSAPSVFISHSSDDNDFGKKLERRLKAEFGERNVFYDSDGGLHRRR